jgi:hypothetical protein
MDPFMISIIELLTIFVGLLAMVNRVVGICLLED